MANPKSIPSMPGYIGIFKNVASLRQHFHAASDKDVCAQWPGFDSARARPSTKELFLMIPMHMVNREIIPGR